MTVQHTSEPATKAKHHRPALKVDCRHAYVRGEVGSLAELARLKGVPFLTLRAWAHKGHWGKAREQWMERQEEDTKAQPSPSSAPAIPIQNDDYYGARLARVRAIIDDKEKQLATTTDPLEADRLARAIRSLDEIEQVLAGRPKPGSRRPGKERAAARPEIRPLD